MAEGEKERRKVLVIRGRETAAKPEEELTPIPPPPPAH